MRERIMAAPDLRAKLLAWIDARMPAAIDSANRLAPSYGCALRALRTEIEYMDPVRRAGDLLAITRIASQLGVE